MLGHKVSKSGMQVDNTKVEVTEKFPPPVSVKVVHNFLGHASFYGDSSRIFPKFQDLCVVFWRRR